MLIPWYGFWALQLCVLMLSESAEWAVEVFSDSFYTGVVRPTELNVEVTENHVSISQETQTNYCTHPTSLN